MTLDDVQILRKAVENGDLPLALENLLNLPLPASTRNLVSYLLCLVNMSTRGYALGLIDFREHLENIGPYALKTFDVFTDLQRERTETFVGHMVKSGFVTDEELSGNKEFVHAFSQTLNKVLETNRSEKIEYFSNLLNNSFSDGKKPDIDEFEFNLKALDGLNFIEIQLLVLLFNFEQSIGEGIDTAYKKLEKMSSVWLDFIAKVEEELNLDRDECEAYFYSIEKSGMINFQKQRLGETKNYGACTTILFWKLYKKIINEHF